MNAFLQSIASALEVDNLDLDTSFRTLDDWCSLKAFGLLVTLENDWATPLTIDQFRTLMTCRDLYREAFISFAASLFKVPRETLSGTTAYESIPQWDSVNHLRLVMEAEKRFATHYALEQIPALKTLNDFLIP
jgi:acyl carrier protein